MTSEQERDPELARDLQEARSIRYGLTVRVALLSSGNWAIFWRDGQGREQLEIQGSVLDEGGMRTLGINQRLQLETEPGDASELSAEEMGL